MPKRNKRYFIIFILLLIMIIIGYYFISRNKNVSSFTWQPPDTSSIPLTEEGYLIRYGRDLIANTSFYFGPKGIVAAIVNGTNCQNCHLDAGTRAYGNSFAAVASTYPKYRNRSGRVESVAYRIMECMERSMNGKAPDTNSREVKAMIAYIDWIGKDVPKGYKSPDAGIVEIDDLPRAANVEHGKQIYFSRCISCHSTDGQGLMKKDSTGYIYPPLWGDDSYNVSAGMYRIGRLAAFVKYNMPFTSTPQGPQLTNEQAWDVAAFINSQERPEVFFSYDWPKLNTKPADYPFGPFADTFSPMQHKYGPFAEIKKQQGKIKAK